MSLFIYTFKKIKIKSSNYSTCTFSVINFMHCQALMLLVSYILWRLDLSHMYCGGWIGQSINLAHVGEYAWHACALMLESVTFRGSQFIALIPCLTTTTTPRRHYPCITMICQETHSPPNTRMCTWLQVWDSGLFAPVQAIPRCVTCIQTFLPGFDL